MSAEPEPRRVIGAHELSNRANITYRQLDHWTRSGLLVTVTRRRWEGSGVPREYPEDQLAIAILMGQLTKAGFQPRQAREIADDIRETGRAKVGDFTLIRGAA